MATQLSPLQRETTGLKTFPLFTLLGWILIGISILVLILVVAPTAGAYFGGNAKAIRDAAESGSPLLAQLSTISWWPKVTAPLIFLGVASFMVGIAMEFGSIPGILDRRTNLLEKAVPLMGNDE